MDFNNVKSVSIPEGNAVQIYDGSHVIFEPNPITEVSPLNFCAEGNPLVGYSIAGKTVQNGTPTPDEPIMPQGTGERTANLVEEALMSCNINSYGTLISNSEYNMFIAKIKQGQTYSIDEVLVGGFFASKPTIGAVSYNDAREITGITYFTAPIDGYVAFRKVKTETTAMMNEGSALLPYEPYGYKIQLTNAGQTVPVYLGQTQTVRRVKKLVLTGEEGWVISTGWKKTSTSVFYMALADIIHTSADNVVFVYSNAFAAATRNELYNGDSDMVARTGAEALTIRVSDGIATTVAEFKTYLAQQYAAGTPVTIWYVLETTETAIVNEPLVRIGDYADELRSTEAGVSIPTVAGYNTLNVDTTVKPSQVSVKTR